MKKNKTIQKYIRIPQYKNSILYIIKNKGLCVGDCRNCILNIITVSSLYFNCEENIIDKRKKELRFKHVLQLAIDYNLLTDIFDEVL